jgi:hypothetical protein
LTDTRLSPLTEMFPGEAERVLAHLDGYRPLILVDASAGPAARLAAMSLYSLTARLLPHTELVGSGQVPRNPWGVTRLEDLSERLKGALPGPSRMPHEDIRIGIGVNAGADLYLGGDDWTAILARVPVFAGNGYFPIGWQGAAVLAAAEVAKTIWSGLGLVVNPLGREFVWNYLNHRCEPSQHTASATKPINLAVLGGGSVGSSTVGIVVMIDGLAGHAVVVDDDDFDPSRNPYRYPAATVEVSGPKATWLADMLRAEGWDAQGRASKVGAWVRTLPEPGWRGVAVSSVDDVEGRFEVADLLAETTISLGIKGLRLHLQREHLGDGSACPYCDFVDVRPPISESQAESAFTGIPAQRIETIRLTGARLTQEDVRCAVDAGRINDSDASQLVGRRFEDLVKRVYADALVPALGGNQATPVSAPHVSWAAGVLAAAEVAKAAMGVPLVNRRVDLDLSGLPQGLILKRPADRSGRCPCASPVRQQWMARLYSPLGDGVAVK